MKTQKLLILALSLCAALPLRAQLFSPESFGGAALGAITGAIIGGHHHAGEGAAIGAGAGFLLGTIAHAEREREYCYSPYSTYYAPYPYYGSSPYYYGYQPAYYGSSLAAAPTQTQSVTAEPQTAVFSAPNSMSGVNALFGR